MGEQRREKRRSSVTEWRREVAVAVGRESSLIERLGAADLMLVWSEANGWPQDIGALAILDRGSLVDADGRSRSTPSESTSGGGCTSFPASVRSCTGRRSGSAGHCG